MIHSFSDMIAYLSRNETIYPGEFLGSGTVGGCCGLESGHWLKAGDVVELDFDLLGTLRNRVGGKSA
jgi:2-keto-4-pentenoate hydratase/2-oxohepta-3-ene-1,7-dioic acid hydratase in catechol pathway